MRRAVLFLCLADLAAWALIAGLLLTSGSDPATRGLDLAAAAAVTVLFGLTALPAFLLFRRHRAPRTALALALAFPAVFLLLTLAVATALP
jgi:hypothetical protein